MSVNFPVLLAVYLFTPTYALFPIHGWGTGSTLLWADWSPNPDSPDWPLTDAQIADMSSRYSIHSLEQCFGCSWSQPCNTSEVNVIDTARRMKASAAQGGKPPPFVLMYQQTQMPRSCFASNAEYMSNPEWFLRYDTHAYAGQPVRRNKNNPELIDNTYLNYLNASAQEWWVNQAWAQPGGRASIDGIYADSAGFWDMYDWSAGNLSKALTSSESQARMAMLNASRAHGYTVMYNGMQVWSRYAPNWDEETLNVTDGADIEHWGAFECINPDGTMNTSTFSQIILQAYDRGHDGRGKGVFIKAWPGPIVAPVFFLPQGVWGNHRMSPSWPGNSTPLSVQGRSDALLKYFPFAYATFLMAAGERSYLHYSWWYDLCDGTSPTCKSPMAWADLSPWLSKTVGEPLGPPTLTNASVFSRSFGNLNVTVDISDWFSAQFQWGPS